MDTAGRIGRPLVSVIITCYNYGPFLKESIQSAIDQSYKPIEIIVVNDGSTDETEAVCRSFEGRIEYRSQPNQGLAKALNTGIGMSHGDFLYLLSADDKLFPEAIERELELMESDNACAVVCGNAKMIDSNGRITGDNSIPFPEKNALIKMLGTPSLHDGSLLWRRASLEKINALYFDPVLGNYHIYHFKCFLLLAKGFRIRHLNEYIVYQRVHDQNLSHPKHIEAMIEGYGILRKEMRRVIDPCDLLEGADPKSPADQAHADFISAGLFFHFGQYEVAYQDLKRAVMLDRGIWERREVLGDPRLQGSLSPVMPIESVCKVHDLIPGVVQKRPETGEILARMKQGEVFRSFFLCQQLLEEAHEDPDSLFLLALVYLLQRQWHDSLNRFHTVTKGLLERVRALNPLHSMELYVGLGLLKEEGFFVAQLNERSHVLGWFDLDICLWLAKMAVALGRKNLVEQVQAFFRSKGLAMNYGPRLGMGGLMEKKMKQPGKKRVLFVNPPYRRFIELENACFPLSVGYMATVLKEKGYEVGIYDADYDRNLVGKTGSYEYTLLNHGRIGESLVNHGHPVWREIEQVIRSFEPDLVGVTAMTNKYPMVERIAEITKSVRQEIPVVIGGHHPSIYGERLVTNRNIDFAVRGEGERTMAEMTDRYFAGFDISGVPGLIYKEGGKIRINPPRSMIPDMDLLPIPDRSLILNDRYVSGNNVMTSRGCPYRCSYCGASVIWERKVRRRSVEKVMEEIRGLIRSTGSRSISFWDDSFTLDRNYVLQLMGHLRAIDGLTFSCITRLDLVDPEILSLLKAAGCNNILLGVESGSDRILKAISKGMNRDLIRKKIDEVRASSIPWLGFFIMGYPGETKEEIIETLHFMKELDPDMAEINLFNPLPGTPVWREMEEKGLVHEEMDFSRYSQSSLKNRFIADMDQEDFEELARKVARAFDQHNRQKQEKQRPVPREIKALACPIEGEKRKTPLQSISAEGLTSALPGQVHFLMIDRCNSKCVFYGGDYFRSESGRRITLETFKQMASNLKLERFSGIVLSGAGDPLLNSDLIPIIRYVNTKYPRVGVAITTNGIALSGELSRALLERRLTSINVSINAASRAVYKRVMQVDCFDRVCKNTKEFLGLRDRIKGGTSLQFSCAISRLNIEDLPRLVELGHELGINSINVMYCRFYPERIRHLNIDRIEDRLEDRESLYFHQELSDRLVERARALAGQYGIAFSHEPLFRDAPKPGSCAWPEREIMVGFDGEIYPCGGAEVHFREKVEKGIYDFGNALREPIEKFWNGEMYRALRISARDERIIIPECRCCANKGNPREKKFHIMEWEDPPAPQDGTKAKAAPGLPEEKRTEDPLVSVIVPTYNRPEMLVETLRSVLSQTYPHYEIVVVNDGGADVENIISFLNQEGRITYVKHSQNRGPAGSRNTGIRIARGKFIAYLDDDDIYYPDHLETLVRYLESHQEKVAYTDAYRAHQAMENGRYVVVRKDLPYSSDFDPERILDGNFIPVLCVMHEKSCIEEAGCFDETLCSHEDWDLWIRMSRRFRFNHINRVTCEFTWRTDRTTMTFSKKDEMDRTRRIVFGRAQTYREEALKVKEKYRDLLSRASEGRTEEAIQGMERFLESHPDFSEAHNDLGVLYFQKGEREKALSFLQRAFTLDPKNVEAMKNLADLYAEFGRMKEATGLYQKILGEKPDDVESLLKIGTLCFRAGLCRDSARLFQRVLEIEPENAIARESLQLLKQDENPPAAIEEIESPLPEKDEDTISIIIPVFNQVELTKRCLETLNLNIEAENGYEVIIVDNASTDETAQFLQEACLEYPALHIQILQNKENLGFAKACNQGAKVASGRYLVFLNNDTEPQPGWLKAGIDRMKADQDIGIVGAKLLYPDRTVQHCGIQFMRNAHPFYSIWPLHRFRYAREDDERVNRAEEVQAVTGACLFIPKGLFDKAGGFTEDYRMYFEDTDLCFKVRQHGKRVFYEPRCVAIHHEGKSSSHIGAIHGLNEKSAVIFYRRWAGELTRMDLGALEQKREGKFIYLAREILPETEEGGPLHTKLDVTLRHLAGLFQAIGPFYAHFGGAGDALLLLSTFYDKEPQQTIVSIANSPEAMRSLFQAFPLLKAVYFVPFPRNHLTHTVLRKLFRVLRECKGMGITPGGDYFEEWTDRIDIFQKYKVRYPDWAHRFRTERIENPQVTITPRGSLRGMVGSKRNTMDPGQWASFLQLLKQRDIRPILLGTPEETALFPSEEGCIDRRSYCFEEQMRLIASSDLFIGTDSWGKTFAALAGVPTLVFHSLRGDDLKGWKDPADHVFLDPWKEITVVKDLEGFKEVLDPFLKKREIDLSGKFSKKEHSPQVPRPSRNHVNGNFIISRNGGLGDVLMALPVARGIKQAHPEDKVSFVAPERYREILRANPYVDRVVSTLPGNGEKLWDLNAAKYGIGDLHEVDAFLKEVGLEVPDSLKEIVLTIPRGESRRVDRLLRRLNLARERSKIILIHAAKGDINRTWPASHWNRLSQMFLEEGYHVIATGNTSSDPARGVSPVTTKGVINLVDSLTPLEFVCLCRKAGLLVTTDSGPVQLAGASDIAIAGIYTVIPGRCRLPYRRGELMWNAVSIEPGCEFSGCYRLMQDERYFRPAREAMEKGSLKPFQLFGQWCLAEDKFSCLQKQITPELVFGQCQELLHKGLQSRSIRSDDFASIGNTETPLEIRVRD